MYYFVYYCKHDEILVNYPGGINMTLLTATDASAWTSLLIPMVLFVGLMYFMIMRPQKKEQKRVQSMLSSMAVGDSIVTTSGFYGVLIDMTDEDVIVEFGSNKNCRIPMRKAAIAEVEKAEISEN
jgi:preprotein translocase subunit YajC